MATASYEIEITLSDAEKEELKGQDGAPGKSAYEIAVENGFVGPEEAWLSSLEGEDGEDGEDSTVPGPEGKSAYEVAVDNGFTGTESAWLTSLQGEDGEDGEDGDEGLSAYQVALENGFVGTQQQWLDSLRGPAGSGGGSLAGIVQLDQFSGNDDQKMAAAIAHVQAQAKYPTIQLPARDINLTQTIQLFTGLRIIAPFGADGPRNLELANGTRYSPHRILLAPNMTLFSGSGTLYDVFIDGLTVQGNFTQTFLQHASGTLYASVIRGITAYGMRHVIGTTAAKALFTQVTLDGFWQVVSGGVACLFHIGGSDNHFWDNGYLNIGGNASGNPDYLVWLDGIGKTVVGPIYITCGSGYGLRINGGSEGGVTIRNAVIEGYHSSNPATQLVRVDGGSVNLQNLELGWANNAIVVNNGRVRVRDTNYYQDSAHQGVALVVRNNGTVLQSGTATSWGTLTA